LIIRFGLLGTACSRQLSHLADGCRNGIQRGNIGLEYHEEAKGATVLWREIKSSRPGSDDRLRFNPETTPGSHESEEHCDCIRRRQPAGYRRHHYQRRGRRPRDKCLGIAEAGKNDCGAAPLFSQSKTDKARRTGSMCKGECEKMGGKVAVPEKA
jgi:hypothetical protein